jgi:hypothetical protein
LSKNMSSAQLRLSLQHADRSRFILSTFKHFCRVTRFQRKWRPAEHWTALMHLYYDIPEPLKFNGNDLSNVLRKDPVMQNEIKRDQNLPNLHGIYHDQYKPGKWNTHCYYACKPGEEYVHALPTGKKWYDTISSIPELQKECDAISCSTRKLREFPHDVIDIVSRVRHLVENERPTKRTRLDEDTDNVSTRLSSLEYHFLFLFDHSCGHDRARHDALNVNNMNTGYGWW